MFRNRTPALIASGPRIAGTIAALIGTHWLGAWLGGWAATWAASGAITTKSNMALALVLGGVTLFLVSLRSRKTWRLPGSMFALIIVLIGGLTFSEHLFRIDLGIDQLLATEPAGAAATASPNRMGPLGAVSLVLLGTGFLSLFWGRRPTAQYLGLIICVISLIPAVGFLYSAEELYDIPQLTGMAWPTVIALVFLGGGLILVDTNKGPMARYLRADAGGATLRRMVPTVILLPLGLGLLTAYGQRHEFFDTSMGIGVLVIASILVFTFLLWRTASALSREEEAAREARTNLYASRAWFHRLFGTIEEGFCTIEMIFDEQGKPIDYLLLETNRAFEKQTGLKNAEGQRIRDLMPEIESYWFELYGRVAISGETLHFENEAKAVNRWYQVTAFRFGQPEERKVAVLFNDITERKQTEEAVLDKQRRLTLAMDAGRLAPYEIDLTTNTVVNSPRLSVLFGLEPGAEFRTRDQWLKRIHDDDRQGIVRSVNEAVKTGKEHHFEYRVLHPDGTIHWLETHGRVLDDGQGRKTRLIGFLREVTERKAAEEKLRECETRHAFLVRLGDALRPLADPNAIQEAAERVLGEHLGANRVAYFEVHDGAYVVEHDFVDAVPHIAGRYPIVSFGARLLRLYCSGQIVMHHDLNTDDVLTADERSAFAAIQIRAFVGVPLVKNGDLLAGLAVHMACPRQWTAAEVSLIEATAERTWAAIEQARAERGLRERDERLRLAIQHSRLMAWQCDSLNRFNWVYNPRFGPTEGELLGMTLEDLDGNEAMSEFVAQVREVLDKGAGSRRTIRYAPSKGGERYFDQQIEPVRGAGGESLGIIGTSLDVTERVLAEQRLQRSEEGFRLMIEHSLEPMVIVNEDGLIESISKRGAELLGFQEAELVGTSIHRFLDWSTKLDLSLRVQDFLTYAPSPAQGVVRIKRKQGDWCWIDIHASFVNYGRNPEKYLLKFEPIDIAGNR